MAATAAPDAKMPPRSVPALNTPSARPRRPTNRSDSSAREGTAYSPLPTPKTAIPTSSVARPAAPPGSRQPAPRTTNDGASSVARLHSSESRPPGYWETA